MEAARTPWVLKLAHWHTPYGASSDRGGISGKYLLFGSEIALEI
jgi:hypothetical protein